MRILIKISLIFIPICSFSQSIKIVNDKLIDNFYFHSIYDLESTDKAYYILGIERKENIKNNHYFVTAIDKSYNLISQKELIVDNPELNIHDIAVSDKDDICGLGSIFTNDDKVINYIICYDNTLTKKWELYLNEKYEGSINGFYHKGLFYVITNDTETYLIYRIDNNGNIKDSLKLDSGFAETLENIKVTENGFLIYGWSMQGEQSRVDLINLDYDLNLINKNSFPFSDTPISISLINKNNFAITWETTPSTVTFYSPDLEISDSKEYIRHDFVFKYVLSNSGGLITYLGVNQNKLTGFISKNKQVLDYKNFSPIGIWGRTFAIELDKDRYLIATDKKRDSDFESNIELIEIIIE